MEASFTGTSKITVEANPDGKTSRHITTDFRLDVSKNQIKSIFIDNKDLPTKEGVKPLTQCFIQGLVGNIHNAHDKGWWDSATHLRYIISELTRGFAEVAETKESTM